MCKHNPKISEKLKHCEIHSDLYLIEWFFTLFARAFDVEIVSKVWDLFFLFGLEFVLYKLTLTLFSLMENEILNCKNSDYLLDIIKKYTSLVEPNLLFKTFFKLKLKLEEFMNLLNEDLDNFYLKKLKTK